MLLQNMIQASPNDRLGLKTIKKEVLVFNINCFKWSLYCGYISKIDSNIIMRRLFISLMLTIFTIKAMSCGI